MSLWVAVNILFHEDKQNKTKTCFKPRETAQWRRALATLPRGPRFGSQHSFLAS